MTTIRKDGRIRKGTTVHISDDTRKAIVLLARKREFTPEGVSFRTWGNKESAASVIERLVAEEFQRQGKKLNA